MITVKIWYICETGWFRNKTSFKKKKRKKIELPVNIKQEGNNGP
jgi:hypothetical protein